MNAQQLKDIILSNKWKFFQVDFIKKSGELRSINGQVGLKKDHTGHNPVSHLGQYITVSENIPGGKQQFRNVNVNTITRLAVGGKVYYGE